MNPIVSIIMPSYKNAERIAAAILSVQKQSLRDWELIIVDDGLYEAPRSVIQLFKEKDPRIVIVENGANIGIQKSLNNGLRIARGKYIGHIDDDDEWIDNDKLARQVEFLDQSPEYVLVGTNAIICDEMGQLLNKYHMPTTDDSIRKRILIKNCFLHSTILARKDVVDRAGGYNEDTTSLHIEDYKLWLRLGTLGKFTNLTPCTVRLTIHTGSITYHNRLIQARRALWITRRFRKNYPNFFAGQIVLGLRVFGFMILKIIPIPRKLLYSIQKLYKAF